MRRKRTPEDILDECSVPDAERQDALSWSAELQHFNSGCGEDDTDEDDEDNDADDNDNDKDDERAASWVTRTLSFLGF